MLILTTGINLSVSDRVGGTSGVHKVGPGWECLLLPVTIQKDHSENTVIQDVK